ncbi:MAG: DNA cytosine methyltransferase [Thalassobaculaceae bacterium]|nr:DNA cytosine methyltransferase [Thalassobaculaceae bacterium]
MTGAYYNEIDPYPAQWLRNLIAAGQIADGEVDERSIVDVRSEDLAGFTQCHFFAGIGGWSLALRLAGWPDDQPVWTGSCPCQPFSVAGKRAGFDDDRHLWPHLRRLIAERRPSVFFGEQVAGAPDWLRLVRGDLEAMEYAVGAIPIEAASADADHFRDRYWLVAHHDLECASKGREDRGWQQRWAGGNQEDRDRAIPNSDSQRPQEPLGQPGYACQELKAAEGGGLCAVVDTPGLGWGKGWAEAEFRSRGFTAAVASIDDRQYVECPDGKWRRLPPPGVRWLGTRVPARVAKLRAFGNSIDPRPAAQFIAAFMECRP